MTCRRKLIEVSLPLEAINKESAREKSIRHGHPSTLHLWWARRPLAACRAVLWSSLVDDPSEYMPDEASANEERERLFKILEDLVLWKNVNNEEVLDKARLEIARSVARDLGVDVPVGKEAIREFLITKAPPVLDPFAGGGSIPLEAQRLGLRAYASDLNPVAVLINKALIEIPPKFAGMPPVHPPENELERQGSLFKKQWKGAQGLAEDVRYYGKWMRDEAKKRIGHLYPKAKITAEILAERPDLKAQGLKPDDELTVIAWLWARTVKCPNPACGAQMPLVKSFELSTKKGKGAWVKPIIIDRKVDFEVVAGNGTPPEGLVNRNGARCIVCNTPVPFSHIRTEGKEKRMDAQLLAIVVDGIRGRAYLSPEYSHKKVVKDANPDWTPDTELSGKAAVNVPLYGLRTHGDLFTSRQLVALNTFSALISEVYTLVLEDAKKANLSNVTEHANAVITFLAFAIDKGANYWSSLCAWHNGMDKMVSTFSRQALAMVWDYAEANPFSDSSGNFMLGVEQASKMLENSPEYGLAIVNQADATNVNFGKEIIVSTDPPYYDNISYADLSDFFYIWLRHSLAKIYPKLFATVAVPKAPELVATPYRFGGSKQKAEEFFERGLRCVFRNFREIEHPSYPTTVFYAFRQSESEETDLEQSELLGASRASTGWETMLGGLVDSGFQITGTWPMRTELVTSLKKGMNVLATSVVLVCRPRPADAGSITRREFLAALKKELPPALRQLQQGSIAPVDLAQAAIGPGMAVFSRYKAVLEADGMPMRVRIALALINKALDEFLAEQEGEYDGDTRWALAWYEQFGHNEAPYGVAETLSKAKNTSVEGLAEAGILEARSGKVRLLRRDELALTPGPSPKSGRGESWDPRKDKRPTAWESVQHLIHALDRNGEEAAATLLSHLGGLSETARDLAYRLYTVCERKKWAQDALAYNMLVVAWPRLKELAARTVEKQGKLI